MDGQKKMYDVIIIGSGVSGAASARELSRYKVNACVLEKEEEGSVPSTSAAYLSDRV